MLLFVRVKGIGNGRQHHSLYLKLYVMLLYIHSDPLPFQSKSLTADVESTIVSACGFTIILKIHTNPAQTWSYVQTPTK